MNGILSECSSHVKLLKNHVKTSPPLVVVLNQNLVKVVGLSCGVQVKYPIKGGDEVWSVVD